jgi:hypothetical protein
MPQSMNALPIRLLAGYLVGSFLLALYGGRV